MLGLVNEFLKKLEAKFSQDVVKAEVYNELHITESKYHWLWFGGIVFVVQL